MSKQRSDKPPAKPGHDAVRPSNPRPDCAQQDITAFHLSPAQYAKVTQEMLAVVRLVGGHSTVSPRDAVQQAWVKALSNPESKRPSIQDFKKFVAYMCALAKYEAMTNRQFSRRRQEREVAADTDVAEWVAGPQSLDAAEARMMLESPFMALEPEEQELLHALYYDGKTIDDIKEEKELPWSTVDSRRKRLLHLLRAAVRAMVVTLLLVPKKARAFVADAKRQATRMLVHANHIGGTAAITGVCGVLVPTGSSFMSEPAMSPGLTQVDSNRAIPAKTAAAPSTFVPEVAPEEPKEVDTGTNECSAAEMSCIKTAGSVTENLIPMTFVLGVALTQVACAGTAHQTPVPQEEPEEEPDGTRDPYEVMCLQERARGNQCLPKDEWLKKIGAW